MNLRISIVVSDESGVEVAVVDMIAGAEVDLTGEHFKAAYLEPALQNIFEQVKAETRKRLNG